MEQDDFDLNEIFAEYFINEFDDPMNAYTSSMTGPLWNCCRVWIAYECVWYMMMFEQAISIAWTDDFFVVRR